MFALYKASFCVCFVVFQVQALFCFFVFCVSTSAIDCLERLVFEMTCYVLSGTLSPINSTQLNSTHLHITIAQTNINTIKVLHKTKVNSTSRSAVADKLRCRMGKLCPKYK